jgi:hypothetical protein
LTISFYFSGPDSNNHGGGIQGTFKLKDDQIEKPQTDLGAQLKQRIIGSRLCLAMNCEQYVIGTIANIEAKPDKLHIDCPQNS